MIGAAVALATNFLPSFGFASPKVPDKPRIIIDNDFAGDPDGLFQLAHHVLCPSLTISLIVSSHLPALFSGPASANEGAAKAGKLLELMHQKRDYKVIAGTGHSIAARSSWESSPATDAIIQEAMRADAGPLIYAAGAGLTELALAWLKEPRIGRRIKLVWIGGNEHPELASPPPGPKEQEFNLSIDPIAAQVIFNESDIDVWQVPRNAYRQMLCSRAELDELCATGEFGKHLGMQIHEMEAMLAKIPDIPLVANAETYVLGDSPLVTLTALMSPIQPDTSSSRYVIKPTPYLQADGTYKARKGARSMRVYTQIDSALTFHDMAAKFKRHAAS